MIHSALHRLNWQAARAHRATTKALRGGWRRGDLRRLAQFRMEQYRAAAEQLAALYRAVYHNDWADFLLKAVETDCRRWSSLFSV